MRNVNKFKEDFPRISIKDLHAFLKAKKDMMDDLMPNYIQNDEDDEYDENQYK